MSEFELRQEPPPTNAFCKLRYDAGWGKLDESVASKALLAGVLNTTAYSGSELIGFGRVIGDGVMYFYICDIIVTKSHRGKGVATAIIQSLMDQIYAVAPSGATVALMSAHGKESLYRKFGFIERPDGNYGAGMTLFLE